MSKSASRLTLIASGLLVGWIALQLCRDLMELRAPPALKQPVAKSDNAPSLVVKPLINFQQTMGRASLDVRDSTLLQVLKHIAASMHMELVVAPDISNSLHKKVSMQWNDRPLDELMSSLIPGVPYFVQSVQSKQDRGLRLCIGSDACRSTSATAVEVSDAGLSYNEAIRQNEIANAIPEATEPGQDGADIPSRQQLRERFAYADVITRLAILRQLDGLEQDTEFIADVLYRDEDASVRQAAVRKLLFTQTEFVKSTLLNALSDEDETVVMLALNGLVDFDDTHVRHQANNLLANRNSSAIKLTMQMLGIP